MYMNYPPPDPPVKTSLYINCGSVINLYTAIKLNVQYTQNPLKFKIFIPLHIRNFQKRHLYKSNLCFHSSLQGLKARYKLSCVVRQFADKLLKNLLSRRNGHDGGSKVIHTWTHTILCWVFESPLCAVPIEMRNTMPAGTAIHSSIII